MSASPSSTRSTPQITLNPLIKYVHVNYITTSRPPPTVVQHKTIPILWDVRKMPTIDTVRHFTNDPNVTIPLSDAELNESATYPPVEALHITCGLFEEKWPIWAMGALNSPPSTPSGSSGSRAIGITILDESQRRNNGLSSGSYSGYPSSPSSAGFSSLGDRGSRRISVGSSNFGAGGRGITVLDVLQAIYTCMNSQLLQEEWDRMSKKHQDKVNVHFDSRWRNDEDSTQTRSKGVLRGDCLLYSHIFAGLEVLYVEGEPGSPRDSISTGNVRWGGATVARCILIVHRSTK